MKDMHDRPGSAVKLPTCTVVTTIGSTMETTAEKTGTIDTAPWRRIRYLMVALITLALTSAQTFRAVLSIAIVAMTDNSTNPDFETFNWDLSTQSTTLSSFYWGYVLTSVPSGMFITRYGARWILLAAIAICSFTTYFIPLASSSGGWQALCGLRVVQGLSEGSVFPSIYGLLSKWAPPAERGMLGSVVLSGMQIGNIITLPISGALASGSGGWPSIFYLFASLGVVWCILWIFLGYNSPADHPYITEAEKNYIESFYTNKTTSASFYTPWIAIFSSRPMWALLLAVCVQNWGYYMILTEMPTYMKNILKFDIKKNGALTSLPYIFMFFLTYFFGWLADLLVTKNIFRLLTIRKLFTSIGFMGPMAGMIGLGYVGQGQKEMAVALLVLSTAVNAGVIPGFSVNHLDMSPNFASVLMGITNGISNLVTLAVPLIVAVIVTDEKSEEQWQTVFWITAGVYMVGTIIFLVFGSADVQPWNESKKKRSTNVDCALDNSRSLLD